MKKGIIKFLLNFFIFLNILVLISGFYFIYYEKNYLEFQYSNLNLSLNREKKDYLKKIDIINNSNNDLISNLNEFSNKIDFLNKQLTEINNKTINISGEKERLKYLINNEKKINENLIQRRNLLQSEYNKKLELQKLQMMKQRKIMRVTRAS